jgi:TonB family protein
MLTALNSCASARGWREIAGLRCRVTLRTMFLLLCLNAGYCQTASEYQIKAAYLYNFAKSAEWPERSLAAAAPLVIGVVGGEDEFVDVLKKIVAGRSIGAHPVVISRVSSDEEAKTCHMLFFRSSVGHKRTQSMVALLLGAGILLVGEDSEFLRQGGMIDLVPVNGKIRFEVDTAALDGASIHLSSELLALANTGHGGPASSARSDSSGGESRRLRVGPQPDYPEMAQRLALKGTVQLELLIARDGSVKDVRVIGGHPLLAEAAVKTVKGWQYEPADKETKIVTKISFGQ